MKKMINLEDIASFEFCKVHYMKNKEISLCYSYLLYKFYIFSSPLYPNISQHKILKGIKPTEKSKNFFQRFQKTFFLQQSSVNEVIIWKNYMACTLCVFSSNISTIYIKFLERGRWMDSIQ